MATRVDITMICDDCKEPESEDKPVITHEVRIDRQRAREVDVCDPCWAKVAGPLAALLAAPGTGQRANRRR